MVRIREYSAPYGDPSFCYDGIAFGHSRAVLPGLRRRSY